MGQDKLKLYSVKVEEGSGCFFQPMTDKYTYILTAKHLFYEVNDQGKITNEYEDGREIEILKHQKNHDGWELQKIPFVIEKGVNYFPHKDADVAILKIEYEPYFNSIFVKNTENDMVGFQLCGFPVSKKNNLDAEKYGNQNIYGFGATGQYCKGAQLFGTLQQSDIEGYSGCGILKIINENIYIAGIQSKMASNYINQAGQIGFVQIAYFDGIVDEYEEQLEKLFPDYMGNFSFLEDEAFKLEVDALDEERIASTRTMLKNKALDIIKSDITPYGIKMLFNERILLNDQYSEHLSVKNVWISWLEFLTIMNIAKGYNVNKEMLSEIFNTVRLKYSNEDDWTKLLSTDLLNSDYKGLKPDSTVIVSTNKPPIGNLILKKETILSHIGIVPKKGLRIDNGVKSPYEDFDFVHLEFFKKGCIADQLEQYDKINDENKLLQILKQQYNELFS
ncbi:ABC-three component system protein [Gaetbulibacter sp. M235]|uniref:ABC-three component system protein n=1 Tax=Gaetbulibacter sp. M235 TaxID=3126510 RepID=UPI00374F5072